MQLCPLLAPLASQLRDLLQQCLPEGAASLDAFQGILVAILSDDPYAALRAIRAAYGDGWLLAHLWDLFWRAGAVRASLRHPSSPLHPITHHQPSTPAHPSPPLGTPAHPSPPTSPVWPLQVGADDPMADTGMDVRSYLMLQHAKALGSSPPLWQLSAQYTEDLIDGAPSSALFPPPRQTAQAEAVAAATAREARAWLCELVLKQPVDHVVKLRKLVALCERHRLHAEAEELIAKSARHKRALRYGEPASAAAEGGASPAMVSSQLEATAEKALDEAVERAKAAGLAEEGRATAELRAMLRNEGVGGARYYSGPRWLPPYFALLEVIASPGDGSGADGSPAKRGAEIVISLASARGDVVGDALPDMLMLRLLAFVCGCKEHAAAHAPMLVGGAEAASEIANGPSAYSVADTHMLLGQLHVLQATLMHDQPAEGPASRSVPDVERHRALSDGLASAILREAARGSRGSCWGAGL